MMMMMMMITIIVVVIVMIIVIQDVKRGVYTCIILEADHIKHDEIKYKLRTMTISVYLFYTSQNVSHWQGS